MNGSMDRPILLARRLLSACVMLAVVSGAGVVSTRAQETSRSLSDTLEFMAGSLKAGGPLNNKERTVQFTQLFDSTGCYVTVTDRHQNRNSAGVLDQPWDVTDKYSLSDIDPQSIKVLDSSDLFPYSNSIELDTTNYRAAVVRTTGSANLTVANPGFMINSDYAPRFVQALKHAIVLCGGKSSAF
jgi:hypothetical protein